jgi:hypothetical protein
MAMKVGCGIWARPRQNALCLIHNQAQTQIQPATRFRFGFRARDGMAGRVIAWHLGRATSECTRPHPDSDTDSDSDSGPGMEWQ